VKCDKTNHENKFAQEIITESQDQFQFDQSIMNLMIGIIVGVVFLRNEVVGHLDGVTVVFMVKYNEVIFQEVKYVLERECMCVDLQMSTFGAYLRIKYGQFRFMQFQRNMKFDFAGIFGRDTCDSVCLYCVDGNVAFWKVSHVRRGLLQIGSHVGNASWQKTDIIWFGLQHDEDWLIEPRKFVAVSLVGVRVVTTKKSIGFKNSREGRDNGLKFQNL